MHEMSTSLVTVIKVSSKLQKCSEWVKIKYTTQTTWHQKKTHIREIDALSSAIDKIVVQGSKVFNKFSGNEKVMSILEAQNKTLLAQAGEFLLKILLPVLGDFIMIL